MVAMTVPYAEQPNQEARLESGTKTDLDPDSSGKSSIEPASPSNQDATGVVIGDQQSTEDSRATENDTEEQEVELEVEAEVEIQVEPEPEESSSKEENQPSEAESQESIRDRDLRIVTERYSINFEEGVPGKPRETRLEESSSTEQTAEEESRLELQELKYSLEKVVVGEDPRWSCSGDGYDPEGELNFHEAVRSGDAGCVATLIARGGVENLDEPDWNVSGDPPLLAAASNHCFPVLTLLLEKGCDAGARSPRGETALHRVIQNGGPGNVLKFVGELLKHGCPPSVKEAGGGLTALHVLTRQLAHAQGSKNLHHNFDEALQTLELLAKAGPVNAQDHQGRSALHILTSSTIFDNNHATEIESLIGTLLAAGADPSLKNDRGETPLHECLECGALNTAFLLIPHTPTGIRSRYGETPLHIASRKNYADVVAKLLEHGEDPALQDAGGNTPLHLASARGFHQTVSLLVTSPQAQLEKLNIEGLTALQVAAESGFVNAVRILLKAGADPSHTMHYCTTTLQRYPDISVLINHELTRRRQLAA